MFRNAARFSPAPLQQADAAVVLRPVRAGRRDDPGRERRPDPLRNPRAVVKHVIVATGRRSRAPTPAAPGSLAGAGPALRLAAWRAVRGAQRASPVYAARYQQLTSRAQNKLTHTRPKP